MPLFSLVALAIVVKAALKAWLGWLDLKRLETSRADAGAGAALGGREGGWPPA